MSGNSIKKQTLVKTAVLAMLFGSVLLMIVKTMSTGRPQVDQLKAACNIANFTIQNPSGYSFSSGCSEDSTSIYTDDPRFTYFLLPEHLKNMPVIKTGNIREKDDRSLAWSINIKTASLVFLLYRKIPGQIVPSWISTSYTKSTQDSFTDLTLFGKRKNTDGLIGLYDVYMTDLTKVAGQTTTNLGVTGQINFGPASTDTTTAYSMYIVGVVPVQ